MMNKKREKIWNTLFCPSEYSEAAVRDICENNKLNPITAKLLYNRGYTTPELVKKFLSCESESLYDPFALADMDKAVARIKKALINKEKIVIYGDYDVDGVTAVSSLYLYLSEKGADVSYYIPSRDGEGYGVSIPAVERFAKDGVNLIITVDTGITASEEADVAAKLGIDMVITDHHECREILPAACAVVNPHRPDCTYPFKELAGVGVVFKLLCAFEGREAEERGEERLSGIRKIFKEYADLTAIGTIADVMPIADENRLIVMYGLDKIGKTERLGLSALIDVSANYNGSDVRPASAASKTSQPKKRKITSSYIGFGIAPRINAAGRISSASKAVELFLTNSPEKAEEIALELCDINRQRQIEENRIAEKAYIKIEEEFDFKNGRVIVLDDNDWQQGIIGIVSSRVTEKYGLPSILISFDGSDSGKECPGDIGKGSGRSIKGLNLVEALSYCGDCLVKYGGHELAAGLTVERGRLDDFKAKINEFALKNISEEMMNITLDADCDIEMKDITLENATQIGLLEPFGTANPVPSFILRDAKVDRVFSIGSGKHTKLILSKDGRNITAMYFGMPPQRLDFGEGDRVDVFFNIDINEYQNNKTVQMIIKDMRCSESYNDELKKDIFRYEYIKGGGDFNDPENVIPTRDDFAAVYNILRRESRIGHDTLNEKILLSMLRGDACPKGDIGYIKMKFIMSVFREMNVCGIEEDDCGYYHFEIYFKSDKANLEKSYILRKLRSQCSSRV
ncbi:MAG: single-stranded-DNA-specific exonuclease RecJ [Clostridia bacterium]|nr:single-stranded-DNA-specific exonuclease RecJ [Clostridia bacterium]